ncbi:MAG: restriction system modified-DNA reader domain-containing protein [Planctomycetota bacterium]|jgi:predicted GIY-YIG superfamily endonuclease
MAKAKKKAKRTSKPIVEAYLERIGQKVFKDFSSVITGLIKGNQGIYALYKRDKLYYIGLASNLKNRIKHHLNDKHKNYWTHFSLYIISKQEHIKEFESVVLRIAYPKGNRVKGKLSRAKNLRPSLKRRLKAEWVRQIDGIIGGKKKEAVKRKVKKTKAGKAERPLKGLFRHYQAIYATYKGEQYKANVFKSGQIKLNGKLYDTPSGAGKAVINKGAVNGWHFWKYKDKSGELVQIVKLRK